MSILDSLAATMAALIVLAGRLPGHTQPGGDWWPPDALANSLVDQLRECGFCPPLCNPGALDLLQHLGGRHLEAGRAWPKDCAGASWRRSGCTCLLLGLDRRFARPTRSRMRTTYDNPTCRSPPGSLTVGTAEGFCSSFVM